MRAFIDTEVSKAELLKTLAWYREADRLTQGWYYWRGERGCAIHEFSPGAEEDHKLYEELFGIPRDLAYLEDAIFEGLNSAEARSWPERFIGSIPEGADLECVADELALWLLNSENSPLAPWRDREYLEPTLDIYRRHLAGLPILRKEWNEVAAVVTAARRDVDCKVDYDAATAALRGHRNGSHFWLARSAAEIAGELAVQSARRGAGQARMRAEAAAWRLIADQLVGVLERTEGDAESVDVRGL